jgi:hypothetical protein
MQPWRCVLYCMAVVGGRSEFMRRGAREIAGPFARFFQRSQECPWSASRDARGSHVFNGALTCCDMLDAFLIVCVMVCDGV